MRGFKVIWEGVIWRGLMGWRGRERGDLGQKDCSWGDFRAVWLVDFRGIYRLAIPEWNEGVAGLSIEEYCKGKMQAPKLLNEVNGMKLL